MFRSIRDFRKFAARAMDQGVAVPDVAATTDSTLDAHDLAVEAFGKRSSLDRRSGS
jgi:hypothetical protein